MHHVDLGSKACKARLLSSPGLPELTEDEIALARQTRLRGCQGSRCMVQCRSSSLSAPGRLDKAENTTPSEDLFDRDFCCSFSRSPSNFVARWGPFVIVAPLARASCPVGSSLCFFGHILVLLFAQASQNSCTSTCQYGPVLPDGFICVRLVPCFLIVFFCGWCFARLDLSGSPGPSRFLNASV